MAERLTRKPELFAGRCRGRCLGRGQRRLDKHGVLFLVAVADGYVMCRRPGCTPFVKSEAAWRALPFPGSFATAGQLRERRCRQAADLPNLDRIEEKS